MSDDNDNTNNNRKDHDYDFSSCEEKARTCYRCTKKSQDYFDINYRIEKETGIIDGPYYFSDTFMGTDEWAINMDTLFFKELKLSFPESQCIMIITSPSKRNDHRYFPVKLCEECLFILQKENIVINRFKNPSCFICEKNQHYLYYFDPENSLTGHKLWNKIVYITKLTTNPQQIGSRIFTDEENEYFNLVLPNTHTDIHRNLNRIVCLIHSDLAYSYDSASSSTIPIDLIRSDILYGKIKNVKFRSDQIIKIKLEQKQTLISQEIDNNNDLDKEEDESCYYYNDQPYNPYLTYDDIRIDAKEWICWTCFIKIDPRYQCVQQFFDRWSSRQRKQNNRIKIKIEDSTQNEYYDFDSNIIYLILSYFKPYEDLSLLFS